MKTEYDMDAQTMTDYNGTGRRNRVLVTLVLGLTAWLGFVATRGWAADSIRFTETVKDQVVCVTNQTGGGDMRPGWFGRFTIDAKVSLAGVNINQFNTKTLVYINVGDGVGDFMFSGSLANDHNYMVGKKRATFVRSHRRPAAANPWWTCRLA